MVIDTTSEIEDLEARGTRKIADIGGQPKRTYWTPDGRMLQVAPSWREYAKRDSAGKVIASGTRDANLDSGWLMQKPEILKPYCSGCDKWHDTEKEVSACQEKRANNLVAWQKKAKRELGDNATEGDKQIDRLTVLEKDMGEIKALLMKLVKGK